MNPRGVDDRLALIVLDSSKHSHEGVVLCSEVEGTSALLISGFRRHRAPALDVGEEVQLSMPRLHPDSESTFPARAVLRSEDRMQVRYHFEVGPAIGWVLAKIADGRFAARVRPYPLAPIGAVLESCQGGVRVPVEVKDISATGIALLVPGDHEPRLFSEWDVRLWLQVPVDSGPPMEMIGRVCSRRIEGEEICYGIDFDSEATPDFGLKQDVIHEYTTSCQAAAIYMFRHGTLDLEPFDPPAALPGSAGSTQPSPVEDAALSEVFRAARELDHLAVVWSELSAPVRQAILTLVDAGIRAPTSANGAPGRAQIHGPEPPALERPRGS